MNLLFIVSGSISAYKAVDVIRKFKNAHDVRVVLTRGAEKFVTKELFENLCGPTYSDKWDDLSHVELSSWADRIIVLPASCNFISEVAIGKCDRLSTAVVLAHNRPALFFPAANPRMLSNSLMKDAMTKLSEAGHEFCEPWVGETACGEDGRGKLPPLEVCRLEIERFLCSKELSGEKVLVLTGRGKTFLDPIRCLTNESSGRTGLELAFALWKSGAKVRICGNFPPTPLPESLQFEEVWRLEEFERCVRKAEEEDFTVYVFAAALPNFIVVNPSSEKLKDVSRLQLKRAPDLIKELSLRRKNGVILVGFCAETSNLSGNCREKMRRKGADLMVATAATKTMGKDRATGEILRKDGTSLAFENVSKDKLAVLIKREIIKLRRSGE